MNGPAFPFQHDHANGSRVSSEALTMRDYFAAQVVAGLAKCVYVHCIGNSKQDFWMLEENSGQIAGMAYRYADAMLKARSNP